MGKQGRPKLQKVMVPRKKRGTGTAHTKKHLIILKQPWRVMYFWHTLITGNYLRSTPMRQRDNLVRLLLKKEDHSRFSAES